MITSRLSSRARRAGSAALALSAAALLLAAPTAGAAPAPSPARACHDVSVPVTLQGYGPATVAGTLCRPLHRQADAVQLLLPGVTYNRTYWDFPYRPERYSYARHANADGYATFAIDRLGTGGSTHPPGASLLTPTSEADVAHQLVDDLRQGGRLGAPFAHVVLTGHSYGSMTAWYEAGIFGDVDAVILSGLTHGVTAFANSTLGADLHPAVDDPKFAGRITDPDYFTTVPGVRGTLFHAADADPHVVALDEATKDLLTTSQLGSFQDVLTGDMPSRIDVPVLIGVGGDDVLECGDGATDCTSAATVLAQEGPWYSPAACPTAYVLPGSGHDMNLAPDAPRWFTAANRWADRVLGRRGATPGC